MSPTRFLKTIFQFCVRVFELCRQQRELSAFLLDPYTTVKKMQIQSKTPGHSMIYKRCSGLMVRSYSFFHEWLENLRTILLQVITSNLRENVTFYCLFAWSLLQSRRTCARLQQICFEGKRKKITYRIQKYILLFVKYVSQYTMRLIRQLRRDFGKH